MVFDAQDMQGRSSGAMKKKEIIIPAGFKWEKEKRKDGKTRLLLCYARTFFRLTLLTHPSERAAVPFVRPKCRGVAELKSSLLFAFSVRRVGW